MYRFGLLLLTLLLASCSEVPCECECPPAVQARMEARLQSTSLALDARMAGNASRKVLVCDPQKPESCVFDVHITLKRELDKNSGQMVDQCYSDLQYCVICVRKGATKRPKVTWRIVTKDPNPARFVFDELSGIDLYHAGLTGKRDFAEPGYVDGRGPGFKWVAGPDRSDALNHGAVIWDTETNRQCKPIDPVIVNTD